MPGAVRGSITCTNSMRRRNGVSRDPGESFELCFGWRGAQFRAEEFSLIMFFFWLRRIGSGTEWLRKRQASVKYRVGLQGSEADGLDPSRRSAVAFCILKREPSVSKSLPQSVESFTSVIV